MIMGITILILISMLLLIICYHQARNTKHNRYELKNTKGDAIFSIQHWNYRKPFFLAGLSIWLLIISMDLFFKFNTVLFVFVPILFLSYWIGAVYEDFKLINIRIYQYEGKSLDKNWFKVMGGGWESEKNYLWMPDDSGVLVLSYRDLTSPVYLYPIPFPVNETNKVYINDPPFITKDYSYDIDFLEKIWNAYGFDPFNPDVPDLIAPLSHRHSEARFFFEIYAPGHSSKRIDWNRLKCLPSFPNLAR